MHEPWDPAKECIEEWNKVASDFGPNRANKLATYLRHLRDDFTFHLSRTEDECDQQQYLDIIEELESELKSLAKKTKC
jgi:hypothetical protein